MPQTEVRAFRDADAEGAIPVSDWLTELETSEPKAYQKCLGRILDLAERGNQLRRPHADFLRDGIYELFVTFRGNIHHRILYFFCGQHVVALFDGVTKEDEVPPREIDIAIERKKLVLKNPNRYTADF